MRSTQPMSERVSQQFISCTLTIWAVNQEIALPGLDVQCTNKCQMSWLKYSQALTNGTMFIILLNCHFELIYTHCSLASLCQSSVHTCSPPPLPEMMHSLACIHWHAFTDIHSHTRVPYADSHTAQVFQQWKPVTMDWQWSCINAPSQLSTGSCIYHHFHLGMTKSRHELHLINLHGNLLFT